MLVCLGLGGVALTRGSELIADSYFDEVAAQGGTTLRLAVSALGGHLSRYEPLPALMADHDDIEELEYYREEADDYGEELCEYVQVHELTSKGSVEMEGSG